MDNSDDEANLIGLLGTAVNFQEYEEGRIIKKFIDTVSDCLETMGSQMTKMQETIESLKKR